MIGVLFRCGHSQQVDPDKTTSPRCVQCGDAQIARTLNAPSPRFTGMASGPCCETRALDPIAVPIATTPLRLKPAIAPAGESDAR